MWDLINCKLTDPTFAVFCIGAFTQLEGKKQFQIFRKFFQGKSWWNYLDELLWSNRKPELYAYLQRCPSQYLRNLAHEALGGVTALFCNLLAYLPCWNKPINTGNQINLSLRILNYTQNEYATPLFKPK